MPNTAPPLFTDESADLTREVAQIIAEPDVWLHTPNAHLGGETPMNLLGTPAESRLRDLVRAIKHGMVP